MLPTIFQPHTCWWCLAPGAMSLLLDKRSKPYVRCLACGVHGFMRTPAALNGFAIISPVVEQIRDRLTTDPQYAETQRVAIASFKRELIAVMRPPADPTAVTGASFRDLLELEQKVQK